MFSQLSLMSLVSVVMAGASASPSGCYALPGGNLLVDHPAYRAARDLSSPSPAARAQCLAARNGEIVQQECGGFDNQQWVLGSERMAHWPALDLCAQADRIAGSLIRTAVCSSTEIKQQWRFQRLEVIESYSRYLTGQEQCLEPGPDGFTGDGPFPLEMRPCAGRTAPQIWEYSQTTGELQLSLWCVEAAGADAVLRDCDGRAEQAWVYTSAGQLQNGGRCLDVSDRAHPRVEPCAADPAQRFKLRGKIANGYGDCIQADGFGGIGYPNYPTTARLSTCLARLPEQPSEPLFTTLPPDLCVGSLGPCWY